MWSAEQKIDRCGIREAGLGRSIHRRGLSVVFVFVATISCSSRDADLARLTARIETLEAEVARLSDAAARPPASESSAFPHVVRFDVGDTELYDGDALSIVEVRGTQPTMRAGGVYLVRARYRLASRDAATLLFSMTSTAGPAGAGSEGRGVVTRGEGELALVAFISGAGYPHVTFYGDDRKPFGGVYFGDGASLLARKSWRYRDP
jgi:hypothetical protein